MAQLSPVASNSHRRPTHVEFAARNVHKFELPSSPPPPQDESDEDATTVVEFSVDMHSNPEFQHMVQTFDVEVFRRKVMRILTALRKLERKINIELDDTSNRCNVFTSHATEDLTHAWLMVKRVTKRVERLRVLQIFIEARLQILQTERRKAINIAAAAYRRSTLRQASFILRRPSRIITKDRRNIEFLSQEVRDCGDLLWKVQTVTEEFESLESRVMKMLMQVHSAGAQS